MGITDEQKDKSGKSKPPLLPKPCISSPAGSGEHVIPQMVITSADDVPEELQNGSEATTVPIPTSIEAASAAANVEEEAKNESTEAVHQRPLTIGACEDAPVDSIPNTPEAKSSDGLIHSTAQRPLMFE
ncbi:uncharacterized protein LOC129234178 [Uloborus diversus]|nr:uncharacterized protein LOC129234178 [Uloborus diversus]